MEDDDEFGDLYTDVLRPLTASFQPHHDQATVPAPASTAPPSSSKSRPIDLNINSDDEEILYGAPDLNKNSNSNSNSNSKSNPSSSIGWNLNSPIHEKTLPEPRGFDLNLDSNLEVSKVDELAGNEAGGLEPEARVLHKEEVVKLPEKAAGGSNFMDDDDDINIVLDEGENKDDDLAQKENTTHFENEDMVGEIVSEQMIPRLSSRMENQGGPNFEDEWESDESEDDLQIVLNENNHGPMGMERMPGVDDDDEDGEPLVIVSDNGDAHHHQHMMMEDQQWGGEEGAAGPDGERKDLGDATKASGVGGTTALPAVQPKVPYNNHVYHHSFHSQFKYVRPGAAPVPPGGIPGQVRPPVSVGPPAGRGRGDWRPPGIKGTMPMQKGFQAGYGVPTWGSNGAGRGYGSGLDFTLPSHKTIFEVDIDSFEEKPWRLSGIDVSDFFNFGLSEDSWKEYCKQLEQLRLETTMQSKIRVYESGRAEQDYDPDLPPELAAAVGIQDIPSENANSGKTNAGPTDLARSSVHGRPALPVGRPIPVETGSGERLPSIDTRRLRTHDTDTIIEIFCQSSADGEDVTEEQDNDSMREDLRGGDETDDLRQDDAGHIDRFSPAYNGQKREVVAIRAQPKITVSTGADILRDDVSHSPLEVPGEYHTDRDIGGLDEKRSTKGRAHAKSLKMTASDNDREKHIMDDQNEELFDREDAKLSPPLSSPRPVGSDEDEAVVVRDDMNDESITDDRSFDMEREEINVDERGIPEDDNLMNSTKKEKRSSRVEQLSQETDNGEDSRAARSSENSKGRSANSRDNRRFTDSVEEEVIQHRRPPNAVDIKNPVEDEYNARRKGRDERDEAGRHYMVVKGREGSYSRRGGDLNSSLRRNVKSDGAEWRKESDISEGSRHQRDEDHYGRRTRVGEPRNREHGPGKARESERSEKDEYHQSRNQLDNGNWRVVNHDQYMGSRQRDGDDIPKSRYEKVDDLRSKRRKEEAHSSREYALKEDISQNHIESSLRKRGRDDDSNMRKRDNQERLKDDNVHYVRQKDEASFQRERSEKWREGDECHKLKQDEIFSRREREDARPIMRNNRASEDKTWISHTRGKDDFKGSGREYSPKDVGRHGDHLKRRDPIENGVFSQHRGREDVYARGDEKRARHERPGTRDERVAYASDTSKLHEHKQKESSRKSKGSESGEHRSLSRSKRNQDEHGVHISETVNLKTRTEQQSGDNEIRQSSRKHKEEALSDEERADSKKGRSKLERWESQKERDFTITSMSSSSSSLKAKDIDIHKNRGASSISKLPEEPSKKLEEKQQPLPDEKDTATEMNNKVSAIVTEDKDKHLDTVEKLKKRSERFKLPMPSEKDAVAIKKLENEPLPSTHTDTRTDSEIKSERPPRKRRWTGK